MDGGMAKKDVLCIHIGILIRHYKEQEWVICRDVDGPRDCHISEVIQKNNCILLNICGI